MSRVNADSYSLRADGSEGVVECRRGSERCAEMSRSRGKAPLERWVWLMGGDVVETRGSILATVAGEGGEKGIVSGSGIRRAFAAAWSLSHRESGTGSQGQGWELSPGLRQIDNSTISHDLPGSLGQFHATLPCPAWIRA